MWDLMVLISDHSYLLTLRTDLESPLFVTQWTKISLPKAEVLLSQHAVSA